MKVLVIGLGSMGKRRIRLIKKGYPEFEIVGIDIQEDRRAEVSKIFGINCYCDFDVALAKEKPTVAFVCSAPLTHYCLTKKCLEAGLSVFSEINLVNENHKELKRLAQKNNIKLFISSTPMYRREIQYITNAVHSTNSPVNYLYHVGQYLPDWHPWENYKDFFVGDKRTSGCKEILCIEMPWIMRAFGEIRTVNVEKNKVSSLDIDYKDSYFITIIHCSGNIGLLCFDVVSRQARRNLCIFGENIHIEWGGTPNSLYSLHFETGKLRNIALYDEIQNDNNYSNIIIENAYMDEIVDFFNFIDEVAQPLHTLTQDEELMKLINRIEEL